MSKYLFIGYHIDDCELSCGGTMIKLVMSGHEVHNLVFALGGANESEWNESNKIIGSVGTFYFPDCQVQHKSIRIADYLYHRRNDYDFVFTHSIDDRHPHHRLAAEETKRVINTNLFTYLAPWNGSHEENHFVELSESQLETKIKALECYKSQAHRAYMHPDFIRAQARYNGIRCGKLYSEGFKVVRLVQ